MDIVFRASLGDDIEPSRTLVRRGFDDAHVKLIDALRASGEAMIDLVAIVDGACAGHLICSRMQSPAHCLGLGPVGTDMAFRKRGIASALIEHAIADARAQGWQALFVLGEPDFYERFGFSVAKAAPFETIYPKDYFMVLELVDGTCSRLSKSAVYPKPFAAL